jgi:molybdate transport system substrate-binding protein
VTDQLDILCAGGFRAAMEALAPRFEAAHGLRLALTFATPAATRAHLEAGFPFHAGVVVASVLAKAQADGVAAPTSSFKLAVSPLGMGTPEGGRVLPVASIADFGATIAALETIALSDPRAGTNVANEVLAAADKLGLGESLRARAIFINGPGSVVSGAVAQGHAQAVITLSSEIVPIVGIRFLGRLPQEMQTEYAMQALLADKAPPAAQALMDYLRAEEAREIMGGIGLEPCN